ncbi:MAG TPA: sulfate ABC transporter permease subunit CysT [Candidatus Polarisedimenticolaceae bacterium]|nr:sulfate ABC transporter permease subunit CysT [Candidatus Polarisedimenticolaceae bacterium]
MEELVLPARRRRRRAVLPGLPLSLGITVTYLGVVILLPLAAVFLKASGITWEGFRGVVLSPRTLAAYRLSFGAAAVAALVNLVFGMLLAWVLERYRFPGRRLVDGLVDLPFALPTAVAGIALASVYAENGWIGSWLAPLGVKVAFTPLGIVVALVFVGLPFVVRTVQPVLHDLDPEIEEAAASLGAGRLATLRRVILPVLAPAALTGFILAFARALGEYGSVIFIAGNMPMKSEITPLLIMVQLEQYDYAGAAAIAVVFLLASFLLLLLANYMSRRRQAAAERGR